MLGIIGLLLAIIPGPSSLLGLALCSVALYWAFRDHHAQQRLAKAGVIVASVGLGLSLLILPASVQVTSERNVADQQDSAELEAPVAAATRDESKTEKATEQAGPDTATPTSSPTTASPSPSASAKPKRDKAPKPTKSPAPQKESAATKSALAAAKTLTVKGRAPKTGYDRSQFGQRWADIDRNGCDQRNDILRRDLSDVVLKAGTRGCVVVSGSFVEPFSGQKRTFQRGPQSSQEIHIDHIVALSDAWQKGAQQWTLEKRTQFGNDFLNLLAIDGRLNQQKGDSDAASWLPPNKSYRCSYVARQVAVKQKYGLWVTAPEQESMIRVLSGCPDQKLPASKPIPRDTNAPVSQPSQRPAKPVAPKPKSQKQQATPKPQPLVGTPGTAQTDPRFGTCKEARAHGYGPYVQGQDVEYGWYRDGDRDGIVCE